jgi:hypothetical protein
MRQGDVWDISIRRPEWSGWRNHRQKEQGSLHARYGDNTEYT